MTPPTFGDFARQVSAGLADAVARFDCGLGEQAAAAAAGEACRLIETLGRYLGDLVPYDEVEALASEEVGAWDQALVDAREALRMAAASLDPARAVGEQPAAGRGPVAAGLAAAAGSLAAGRDLIWTHFPAGPDGPALSEWSAVIGSVPVTRALLEKVVRWSQQLALLTGQWSVAPAAGAAGPALTPHGMANASRWLLVAAATIQTGVHGRPVSPSGTELLMAIPVKGAARRVPPVAPETDAELCAGIEASAARLRAVTYGKARLGAWSPSMTADSWRWTATGAAVTCHISEQMLHALTLRVNQSTSLSGIGDGFGTAARVMGEATDRWRAVVASWEQITTETSGLTGLGVPDTSDLAVRLGRLAFGDPEWIPGRVRQAPLREGADLAANSSQVTMVVTALHHGAEATVCLAAADADAVEMAVRSGRLYVPTRSLPSGYDVPYRYAKATPSSTRDLLSAYQAAVDAAARALTAIDNVAVALEAPSRILIAARTAPHRGLSGDADDDVRGRVGDGGGTQRADDSHGKVHAPGPVEYTLRELGITESIPLLRAKAIDKAAGDLTAWARGSAHQRIRSGQVRDADPPTPARAPAQVAGMNFPVFPTASVDADRTAGPPGTPMPAMPTPRPLLSSSPTPSRRHP